VTGVWRRARRPVLGIALLLAVIVGVSPGAIGDRLGSADLRLVVVAVLGLAAIHAVPAIGWRAILGTTTGIWMPWRTALALYYAAQAIGGITPANLGGDLHRAATLRGSGHGWSVSVAPLIVQRATSYLALSGLSLVALAIVAARAELAGTIVAIGGAFAGAVGLVAWLLLAPPRPLRGAHARMARIVGGIPEDGDGRVQRLGAATVIGLVQGVGFHAVSIALTWLLVLSIDPTMPAGSVLAALTVTRLSLAVPVTPSGLGIQEGALALLFTALGLAPDVALAAMLLARLSLVLTTGVGVVLLLRPLPLGRVNGGMSGMPG
jgi:glycosyltransferase 2 family protein